MRYIIVLILLLISCITSNTTTGAASSQLSQRYFDGCQYITTELGGITHKGNCNNSVHN